MAVHSKPLKVPRWADNPSGPGAIVEPGESKKDKGWELGEKPAFSYFNWLNNLSGDWLKWLDERFGDGSTKDELKIMDPGSGVRVELASGPEAKLHVRGGTIRGDRDANVARKQSLELRRFTGSAFDGTALTVDIGMGLGLVNLVAGAEINADATGHSYLGLRGASRILLHDGEINFSIGGVPNSKGLNVEWATPLTIKPIKDQNQKVIDGNVGIGTASPGAKLEVLSQNQNSPQVLVRTSRYHNDVRGDHCIEFIVGDGNDSIGKIGHLGSKTGMWSFDMWTDEASPLTFSNRNMERMRIDENGNVGIGTSEPKTKLEISSQTSPQILVRASKYANDISGDHSIEFIVGDGADSVGKIGHLGSKTGKWSFDMWTDEAGPLTFSNRNMERMRIDENGNVGIGTPAPENIEGWDRVLDVLGSVTTKLSVRTQNIDARVLAHDIGWWDAPPGMIVGTKTSHPLSFVSNAITRMTIDASGNVGIGTPAPGAAKLKVVGRLEVVGDLKIGTTQTGQNEMVVSRGPLSSGGPIFIPPPPSDPNNLIVSLATIPSGDKTKYQFVIGHTETTIAGRVLQESFAVKFRVNRDGNVGIGPMADVETMEPKAKFHIDAEGELNAMIVSNTGANQGNAIGTLDALPDNSFIIAGPDRGSSSNVGKFYLFWKDLKGNKYVATVTGEQI